MKITIEYREHWLREDWLVTVEGLGGFRTIYAVPKQSLNEAFDEARELVADCHTMRTRMQIRSYWRARAEANAC